MRQTALRVIARPIRSAVTGVWVSLLCVANSLAAVDICDRAVVNSHVILGVSAGDNAELDNGPGGVEQEDYVFGSQYKFENKWSAGVGYRYKIVRFESIEPQTNGHLHTFFIPVHKQSQSDGRRFRFSIAPALSASSNVMKDPAQYNTDALQLLAAVVWGRELSNGVNLRYGICGDHRFGSYKVYPLLSFDWRPHSDWKIALGFPTAELGYRVTESVNTALRFAPSGNEWYVKDKSLQNESRLIYESYLLDWSLDWRVYKGLTLSAGVGWQFQNEYELTLLDGSRVTVSSDPFIRIGAAAGWRF